MIGMSSSARAYISDVAHRSLLLHCATSGLMRNKPLQIVLLCAMLVLLTLFADREKTRTSTLDACTVRHCARNVYRK